MDHYAVLGVHRHSSDQQIREAYLKLVRKYHPDVDPGDPAGKERFLEIQQAFDVLGDPVRRTEYDRSASPTTTPKDRSRKAYSAAEYFAAVHRQNPCPASDPDIPRIMLTATIVWAMIMVVVLLMVFFLYSDIWATICDQGLPRFLTSHQSPYVESVKNMGLGLVCVPTVLYGMVMTFLILGLLTEANTPHATRRKADTPGRHPPPYKAEENNGRRGTEGRD